jgi:hypothetical protein
VIVVDTDNQGGTKPHKLFNGWAARPGRADDREYSRRKRSIVPQSNAWTCEATKFGSSTAAGIRILEVHIISWDTDAKERIEAAGRFQRRARTF